MADNIIVLIRQGRVERVIADFRSDLQCIVVSTDGNDSAEICGEPWVRVVDLPDAYQARATFEKLPIEYAPDEARAIVGSSDDSRSELMQLLGERRKR